MWPRLCSEAAPDHYRARLARAPARMWPSCGRTGSGVDKDAVCLLRVKRWATHTCGPSMLLPSQAIPAQTTVRITALVGRRRHTLRRRVRQDHDSLNVGMDSDSAYLARGARTRRPRPAAFSPGGTRPSGVTTTVFDRRDAGPSSSGPRWPLEVPGQARPEWRLVGLPVPYAIGDRRRLWHGAPGCESRRALSSIGRL